MSKSELLDAYLRTALDMRLEVDYEPQEIAWAMLRARLPASVRKHEQARTLLRAALDLCGIRMAGEGDRVVIRAYQRRTGARDQARRLFDKFSDKTWGPRENLHPDTIRGLATVTGRDSRALDDLAAALSSFGFRPIGRTQHKHGRDRIVLPEHTVELATGRERSRLKLAQPRRIRHPDGPIADALLGELFPQYERYTCEAQRDAVHAIVDSTGPRNVIARLPTGNGKSLLYVLPCAVWRKRGEPSTALVVSPIVALQNDQVEKITSKYAANRLVARQINSTVTAAEKTETYRMFRQGKLDLLFVSPERMTDPFFREIAALAAPHLRLLVIDEAHIVDEWGHDFRPDFFRLGRERERLLEQNPDIKTLFLSATLTQDTEQTLEKVFKLSEPPKQVIDQDLRTEVSIRVVPCANEDQRTDALYRLLDDVPFPCIVYCSRTEHVRELKRRLKERGLLRHTDYMGPTAMDARRERLRWFHEHDVDVVLATSAFGLGVDKADVRTIIHFDVPSSLDAYYQAIGRAARDGWTGHAFMLYSAGSMSAASRENRAILTSERAFERADLMMSKSEKLSWDTPGAHLVPLHVLPADLEKRNALNRTWNAVVLNILEELAVLRVDGVVHRHIRVCRGKNRDALAEKSATLIRSALKAGETTLDLFALSKKHKEPLAALSGLVARLVLARGLELIDDTDDGDQDEWMLVQRVEGLTWSAKKIGEELDAHREVRVKRATSDMRDLKNFIKTRICRFAPIAKVYAFPEPTPCGHCDRCDPSLAF